MPRLADDIQRWLITHKSEINGWNKGTLTFQFRNGRLHVVVPSPEQRAGYEFDVQEEDMDQPVYPKITS